jgi:DNA-binding CsgD family transcriptional regulator
LGQLTSFDPLRIMPMGQAWRARAEVQAGKLRSAESTIRHIGPEYLPGEFRTSALTRSIEAWLRAQGGDSEGAATLAREAGFRLVDHTHIVWGCFLLHDAVRFGHGDRVTDQLAEIAPAVDSALIDSMAAHACALAERDAVRLLEVSKSFQDLGAALLAAEAAAQAASIHAKKHEQHASARATARAVHLAGFAPGADTPALRQLQSFLTPREQGIARLAAQGMSSRAIAEALSISTRTVDNHLGSVYAKLGIQGRNELLLVVQG